MELKDSRINRAIRPQEDYTRNTVREHNQLIIQATQRVQARNYEEALGMLKSIKDKCDQDKDRTFYQELCFHMAILHMRTGNYSQSQGMLTSISSPSPSLHFRILTNLLLLALLQRQYPKVQSLLSTLVTHFKSLPQKLRLQSCRQFFIRLIGLESTKDCSLVNHSQPTSADELLVAGIYKMLGQEYKEAKFYFVKGLQKWREVNNDTESLVFLELIIQVNRRIGKDNGKYQREVSRIRGRLGWDEEEGEGMKEYMERVGWLKKIISTFENQQSNEDKVQLMHRQLPIQPTRIALYFKISKNLTNITQLLTQLKSQAKAQQPSPTAQQLRKITYLDISRKNLQKFLTELSTPQDTIYLLSKYKYATEAYEQMKRNSSSFVKKFTKWLVRLGWSRIRRRADVAEEDSID